MNVALVRCKPRSRVELVVNSVTVTAGLHVLADDWTNCRPDRAALTDADSAFNGLHSLLIALRMETPT
ncbi:MAG: hypothetical protein ABIY40_07715 [Rhodanobacteraceae bacterium]